MPILDEELGQHVAGRQRHLLQIRRIPGGEDDSAAIGVGFDLMDDFHQLIDALVGIIRVAVFVLRAEMTPLEPVNRTQIAFCVILESDAVQIAARAVPLPDIDALILLKTRSTSLLPGVCRSWNRG